MPHEQLIWPLVDWLLLLVVVVTCIQQKLIKFNTSIRSLEKRLDSERFFGIIVA